MKMKSSTANYGHQPKQLTRWSGIGAVVMFMMALVIFLVLKSAHYLSRILGASGIVAISRIIGFIVIAIGVQYISSSIVNIFKTI